MTAKSMSSKKKTRTPKGSGQFQNWLDVLAIIAWGCLLIKYSISGELALLIHPNFFGLVITTGVFLLLISLLKIVRIIKPKNYEMTDHVTLLPPVFTSWLLILIAIVGFVFPPQPFNSAKAIQRGVMDTLTFTRSQPSSFKISNRPENRSLIDWIRTLNVYPEPDEYQGQKVNVTGFAVHPQDLPKNYLLISRFILSCCAADAYPVALPVKLDKPRDSYPQDGWLEIKGQMISDILNNKRQVVIKPNSIIPIPTPRNPYDY